MHYSEQICWPLNRLSCLLLTAFQNKSLEFFMLCLTWLLAFFVTNTWSGVRVLSLGCLFICLFQFTLAEIVQLFALWGCVIKITASFTIAWQGCSFFRCFVVLDFQEMKSKICLLMVSVGPINWVFAVQLIWDVVFHSIPTQANTKKEKVFAPVAEVTDICLV